MPACISPSLSLQDENPGPALAGSNLGRARENDGLTNAAQKQTGSGARGDDKHNPTQAPSNHGWGRRALMGIAQKAYEVEDEGPFAGAPRELCFA
jgi:hypothetical protein